MVFKILFLIFGILFSNELGQYLRTKLMEVKNNE